MRVRRNSEQLSSEHSDNMSYTVMILWLRHNADTYRSLN